ncbi:hypothetical protein B296_00002927 [Ensete ventricosum]|uniref:Uncharacterized protein n=1 Tax=Ensete ventricosum TaxID=4639 RepID=A0A427B392_ENSVE|nr:hypothetical protein B296_00002927 [Ensete ventricosum]
MNRRRNKRRQGWMTEATIAGASGATDVAAGSCVDNQRRRLSVGRGRRRHKEVGETTIEKRVTTVEEGATGSFLVLRLEGNNNCCYVASRNRYCGSLGGSDGGSQALAIMVAAVEIDEGVVLVEQQVRMGGGSEKQERCCCVRVERKAITIAATATWAEVGAGRKIVARGQQLRTSDDVPFLLEMLEVRREGTTVMGKSGRRQSIMMGGEITTIGAMTGCDTINDSRGGCRGW